MMNVFKRCDEHDHNNDNIIAADSNTTSFTMIAIISSRCLKYKLTEKCPILTDIGYARIANMVQIKGCVTKDSLVNFSVTNNL